MNFFLFLFLCVTHTHTHTHTLSLETFDEYTAVRAHKCQQVIVKQESKFPCKMQEIETILQLHVDLEQILFLALLIKDSDFRTGQVMVTKHWWTLDGEVDSFLTWTPGAPPPGFHHSLCERYNDHRVHSPVWRLCLPPDTGVKREGRRVYVTQNRICIKCKTKEKEDISFSHIWLKLFISSLQGEIGRESTPL